MTPTARRLVAGAAAVSISIALVACGDDATTSTATGEGPAPDELVGTYAMTLKPSDLPPNPPHELTDQADHWTLKIDNAGSPDGGPAFTIVNDALGTLESSQLGVSGDRVYLHDEECATGNAPVESTYEWTLDGGTLTFSPVEVGCDDDVVKTLLTSEPWVKR
ncbi:MAG: hypothetical protein QOI10_871 [Solirubrobacterales bacterium]|jgi:hypothetical protein|nr:hypothetical protein [Solirubrobacterales bacterium]